MVKNFIDELFSREIGGVSLHRSKDRPTCVREAAIRQSRKMLRHIFVSKSSQRKFCKLPPIVSSGNVYYDDGKMLLEHKGTNSVYCHAVRDGGRGAEEKLSKALCSIYSIPLKPKWKDQEIWLGPIQDIQGRPNLKDNSLRPCLFVLREDKTLNRYDVDTGHLLESVFLSSTRKYAELRLNYSGSQPNVCVKSTKQIEFCKSNDCTHRNCKQTCISLIMFSYPPLTFLCNFEVTQKIFGSSTTTGTAPSQIYDAMIHNGILIVLSTKKVVRLYNFDVILQNHMTESLKIGEKYRGRQDEIVGQSPLGFPVNIELEKQPPVLFEINSHLYHITMNDDFVPPLCITTSKDYNYKIYNISKPNCPSLDMKLLGFEDGNDMLFHPDGSKRLIHLAGKYLFIYELISFDPVKTRQVFMFNANPDDDCEDCDPLIFQGKKVIDDDEDYDPNSYEAVFCLEDELEIMAVLSCQEIVPLDIEEYGDMQTRMHLNTVTFYDSNTYEKIREFQIDQKIKSGSYGGCKVSMDLDRDVLLIRIKMDSNKTKTLLWKLQWCDNLDSVHCTSEKKKRPPKTLRRPRRTSTQSEENCVPERARTTRSTRT